jgi:hypothetical protein
MDRCHRFANLCGYQAASKAVLPRRWRKLSSLRTPRLLQNGPFGTTSGVRKLESLRHQRLFASSPSRPQ